MFTYELSELSVQIDKLTHSHSLFLDTFLQPIIAHSSSCLSKTKLRLRPFGKTGVKGMSESTTNQWFGYQSCTRHWCTDVASLTSRAGDFRKLWPGRNQMSATHALPLTSYGQNLDCIQTGLSNHLPYIKCTDNSSL